MLIDDVERYLALRRSLGFKLDKVAANLRAFARFATSRGDTHLIAATAVEWSAMAPTPGQRSCRLGYTVRLASLFIRPKSWRASWTRPASFAPT
jgi:integrase/recombinase XerD